METWNILHEETSKQELKILPIFSQADALIAYGQLPIGIPTIDGLRQIGEKFYQEDKYMELDNIFLMISIALNTLSELVKIICLASFK